MAKVLIVDDEAHLRLLYKKVLTKDGHQVLDAATGEEALRLVEQETLDVVILDIEMGDTDGLELLKRFKALKPKLPVILNSAYSIYMADFKTWMAEDYIVKSSDIQPLLKKINEVVAI